MRSEGPLRTPLSPPAPYTRDASTSGGESKLSAAKSRFIGAGGKVTPEPPLIPPPRIHGMPAQAGGE